MSPSLRALEWRRGGGAAAGRVRFAEREASLMRAGNRRAGSGDFSCLPDVSARNMSNGQARRTPVIDATRPLYFLSALSAITMSDDRPTTPTRSDVPSGDQATPRRCVAGGRSRIFR